MFSSNLFADFEQSQQWDSWQNMLIISLQFSTVCGKTEARSFTSIRSHTQWSKVMPQCCQFRHKPMIHTKKLLQHYTMSQLYLCKHVDQLSLLLFFLQQTKQRLTFWELCGCSFWLIVHSLTNIVPDVNYENLLCFMSIFL